MGLIADRDTGRNRVVWALVFTPVFSRYSFVRLSFRQTLEAVIAGLPGQIGVLASHTSGPPSGSVTKFSAGPEPPKS